MFRTCRREESARISDILSPFDIVIAPGVPAALSISLSRIDPFLLLFLGDHTFVRMF